MKYMLMFANSDEARTRTKEDEQRLYEETFRWWDGHEKAGRIVEGYELEPASTATTVRSRNSKVTITDGPFIEAKETIGGYAIVDVKDLDEALALAKTWPFGGTIEVRPIVRRSQ
jgi:hypothetical protein